MTSWRKYTYVCGNCDSLTEITTTHSDLEVTCVCAEPEMLLLSVEDATINNNNQQKEETPMETTIATDMLDTITKKDELIRNLETRVENLNKTINSYYSKEQQLRSYLAEHGEEMEFFAEDIANIFDIPLVKEIEFEATMTVTGTVEVPLFGDFDLDDFLQENLYVDANHGDVCINGQSVDHVVDNS